MSIDQVVIRQLTENDAESFLELCTRLDNETALMMLEPGERGSDVENERARIRAIKDSPNSTTLVAENGSRLVGYISATGGIYRRDSHKACVVVGIIQEYSGRGIGKRFFSELDRWAIENGIHRLELTVMRHNQRAQALYRRCGFTFEGESFDSLKVEGEYVNEYHMAKIFDEKSSK